MSIQMSPTEDAPDRSDMQELEHVVEDLSYVLEVNPEEFISELTALLRRRTAFEMLRRSRRSESRNG